eukprot:TRINITY_DN2866_c0_g1_i2.p1 TRINITY_DN2866_c0_g1~~TRINITY_DN2866_c0_g1_i2.p1  ORF type:complete len:552 (-),score=141.78 TRINITY_DN2866_c0_g1_i2:366-2021(-)
MAAASCVADVESADFVALRLGGHSGCETTAQLQDAAAAAVAATPAAGHASEGVVESFLAARSVARHILPTKLGVCCCRWRPGTPGGEEAGAWELRSHELDLWPGDGMAMQRSKNLRIRRREAAAMMKAPRASRSRTEDADKVWGGSRWAGQLASTVQWVIAAIRATRCPLVVHGGLPELLQIFDKFVADIPKAPESFGAVWAWRFPAGLFDVSFLAKELGQRGRDGHVAKEATLDDLHRHVLVELEKERRLNFEELGLYTHRASSQSKGLVSAGSVGAAGRQAMAIAEIYLQQIAGSVVMSAAQFQAASPQAAPASTVEREAMATPMQMSKAQPADAMAVVASGEASPLPLGKTGDTDAATGDSFVSSPALSKSSSQGSLVKRRLDFENPETPEKPHQKAPLESLVGNAPGKGRHEACSRDGFRSPDPKDSRLSEGLSPVKTTLPKRKGGRGDTAALKGLIQSFAGKLAGSLPDADPEACQAFCEKTCNRLSVPNYNTTYLQLGKKGSEKRARPFSNMTVSSKRRRQCLSQAADKTPEKPALRSDLRAAGA